MKFVIDRSKWLRGEGSIESYLLRISDGKQCCIGQMCSHVGIPSESLRGIKTIGSVRSHKVRAVLGGSMSDNWVHAAYKANDQRDTTDAEKEFALRECAASAGHELEFVN